MRRMAMACVAFLVLAAPASAATVADFAADFSATSNPALGWSYGSTSAIGGPFTLLTAHTVYAGVVEAWNPAGTSWPTIALNTGADPVAFGAGDAIVLAAGQGLLHPGPNGEFADVRYTAASAFSGIFNVTFSGIDRAGTTTDVHVLRNGVSLASGLIGGFGQTLTYSGVLTLGAGEHLDFLVGRGANGNYIDDSTGFTATLTSSAPEPATWALMIGGFGLAGAALRRRPARRPVTAQR